MYGTAEHEAWLIEMEQHDVPDERPDQPWTPCGCTARAYGGDCAHTIDPEYEGIDYSDPRDAEPSGWNYNRVRCAHGDCPNYVTPTMYLCPDHY